jgi:putative addiction module killer protein
VREIFKSATFDRWLASLKDARARARIAIRIDRLAHGNAGDAKPVGAGISELRIDYGPGYRVYFMQRGQAVVVLLNGGDKRSQASDIRRAMEIGQEWKE